MKQQILGLWEGLSVQVAHEDTSLKANTVGRHLAEMLAIGPFYYYTISSNNHSLSHAGNTILSIHGLTSYPETLHDIIALIHPEDMGFVIAAERATLEKIKEIGLEHQMNLKTSYCFRMRVANGSYHLFHHHAISLATNNKGQMISALHIHTDMQHITQVNNKIVLLTDIGKRHEYCQIDLSGRSLNMSVPLLSEREMEVLQYTAQGLSSPQIAEKLFISTATVRVHRKNLLKKTGTANTSNLIKRCIELSLL